MSYNAKSAASSFIKSADMSNLENQTASIWLLGQIALPFIISGANVLIAHRRIAQFATQSAQV